MCYVSPLFPVSQGFVEGGGRVGVARFPGEAALVLLGWMVGDCQTGVRVARGVEITLPVGLGQVGFGVGVITFPGAGVAWTVGPAAAGDRVRIGVRVVPGWGVGVLVTPGWTGADGMGVVVGAGGTGLDGKALVGWGLAEGLPGAEVGDNPFFPPPFCLRMICKAFCWAFSVIARAVSTFGLAAAGASVTIVLSQASWSERRETNRLASSAC